MPPKKEEVKKDTFVEVMFVLIILLFIWILWSSILNYLIVGRFGSLSAFIQEILAWLAVYIWPIVIMLAIIVTIAAVAAIMYNYRKLVELSKEENKIFGATPEELKATEPVTNKNERWERVIAHINSANSSDWRLAIIEADVMLDELLRAQGYHGDSLGEMLKSVEKSDFLSLDAAWDAHKVRNEIAHAGAGYELNEREAKRVISLYESVFREFKMI